MSEEFVFPKPNSMTASEAANWYRAMIPLIPKIKIDEAYGDSDEEVRLNEFKTNWMMKSRLRIAAAAALRDPENAEEFLREFPLPSANEYLGSGFAIAQDERAFDCALQLLLLVTEKEKRKFPGTVGEAIGMECNTTDGIYVMTEKGWVKKELAQL
jgi:hypothetical protein